MNYLYGKIVLITGASSGIGRECALLFAKKGYTVLAASRRGTFDQPIPNIIPVQMDVADEKQVQNVFASVRQAYGVPGIVIHCAGIGICGPAEDTDAAAIRRQFETNFFGVLNVNRFALPGMRERGGGLILVVGSVAATFPVPFQSHYSASKAALVGIVSCLRAEAKDFFVKAALIEPGDTKTGFTSARSYDYPADSVYSKKCKKAVARMERDERNGKPPVTAAKVALKLACKKNPPLRVTVGFDYKLLTFFKRFVPDRLAEFVIAKMY